MSGLLIEGCRKLRGEVTVQGAKNSTLPILAATILTKGENVIFNCPCLSDIDASSRILRYLGCEVERTDHTLIIKSDDVDKYDIPDELMR